jgi:hypothetical protein
MQLAPPRSESLRAEQARSAASQLALYSANSHAAQSDNSSGQNDPVNGHSARFVFCEGSHQVFDHVHGSIPFLGLLRLSRQLAFLKQPLFRFCLSSVRTYSLHHVARIGSKQGIFAPCEKRRGEMVKLLKLHEKKMKTFLTVQVAGLNPPAIWAGMRRKTPILVDIRTRFCDST